MDNSLDYKLIGKRIKIQRLRKNMTQDNLADLTGLSNPHISNIESGSTQLSLVALVQIANALDVTPDALLCDNIKNAKEAFYNEFIVELSDCDIVESSIALDLLQALKVSFREKRKRYLEKNV